MEPLDLPKKSVKAAILVDTNQPLVIGQINLPSVLEYGQVLVKIQFSGVCGSQLGEIAGVKGPDKYLPHLLGHEASGITQLCGPGVSLVKPGDHVVMHWRKGKGIQAPTPQYQWDGIKVNGGWVTTFNEYAVVSENRLTPISKNFDLETAALYGCAITTGFGAVFNDAKLHIGESIAVIGAGGTGLSVILGAKLSSAFPIIAIDKYQHKLDKAKEFGATHIINSTEEDIQERINTICEDNLPESGLDVVVDTTGIRSLRELAYELSNAQGRTILIGVPAIHHEKISIESLPLHFGKSITGSEGGNVNPSYDIPRLMQLQKNDYFNPRNMISHSYKLDGINDAIEDMKSGKVVRCSIDMT